MSVMLRVPAHLIHEGKLSRGAWRLYATLVEERRPVRTSELAGLVGLTAAAARFGLLALEREGLARRELQVVPAVNHAIFTWSAVEPAGDAA